MRDAAPFEVRADARSIGDSAVGKQFDIGQIIVAPVVFAFQVEGEVPVSHQNGRVVGECGIQLAKQVDAGTGVGAGTKVCQGVGLGQYRPPLPMVRGHHPPSNLAFDGIAREERDQQEQKGQAYPACESRGVFDSGQ